MLHPQSPIARTEARATTLAVEVGTAQGQTAQHGANKLLSTARIPSGRGASRTGNNGADVIGVVGVQPPGDRDTGDPERLTTRGQFDGLEVPLLDRGTDERVYLREDLRAEGFFEAPFLAASWEAAVP